MNRRRCQKFLILRKPAGLAIDESVETAVKLVRETKIWLYIHYIYSHTTNLNECEVQTEEAAVMEMAAKRVLALGYVE